MGEAANGAATARRMRCLPRPVRIDFDTLVAAPRNDYCTCVREHRTCDKTASDGSELMRDRDTVLKEIRQVRLYCKDMLSHISPEDWYRQAGEGVTHVAWQVGHLAVCEYGLALKRVRGVRDGDAELLDPSWFELFGKGSQPTPDREAYPTPDQLLTTLDRVHRQVLDELREVSEETLQQPTGPPSHPMFKTKLEALFWCAHHEWIHVGQIGLLRRLLGSEPLR